MGKGRKYNREGWIGNGLGRKWVAVSTGGDSGKEGGGEIYGGTVMGCSVDGKVKIRQDSGARRIRVGSESGTR